MTGRKDFSFSWSNSCSAAWRDNSAKKAPSCDDSRPMSSLLPSRSFKSPAATEAVVVSAPVEKLKSRSFAMLLMRGVVNVLRHSEPSTSMAENEGLARKWMSAIVPMVSESCVTPMA